MNQMECPNCSSDRVVRNGIRPRRGGPVLQEWKCKQCNKYFFTDMDNNYAGKYKLWSASEIEILSQYKKTAKNVYTLYNEIRNSGFNRSYSEVADKIKQLGLVKPAGYQTGYEFNIGYLDIETTGFVANVDVMLSWSIKTRDRNEILGDVVRRHELFERKYDRRICKSLCEALKKYDLIMTFYGTVFDIPFMRTRCMDFDLDFPLYRQISHKDIYYIAKKALKLHRKSLDALCEFLGIDGKTHFDPRLWREARYGDPVALEKIFSHNKEDVIILEKAHKKIEKYCPPIVRPM